MLPPPTYDQNVAQPALELTPDDARLAMDALRRVAELPDSPFAAEARSALAKLRFDLEPPAPEPRAPKHDVLAREAHAAFEREPVIFADGMGTGGVRDVLRRLTEALRSRRRVRGQSVLRPGEFIRSIRIPKLEPGARFVYNNSAYYLLGVLLERLAGEIADRAGEVVGEPEEDLVGRVGGVRGAQHVGGDDRRLRHDREDLAGVQLGRLHQCARLVVEADVLVRQHGPRVGRRCHSTAPCAPAGVADYP